MNLGLISEIMGSNKICMHAPVFAGIRNLILANIDGRTNSHFNGEKAVGGFVRMTTDVTGRQHMTTDMVGNASRLAYFGALRPEDRVINLVRLDGPMSRCGDECTYGTQELRDQIMQSANVPQCRGHIILCNTPGGMAQCIQDMRMAVNYAHDHGQRVYMLIDGECASGGTFTSALCDKVYCLNPEDEIGSIGMFCAFFTLADGAENKITSEVYHEYYASKSTDKNGWYRAAAEGDMKIVEAETNAQLEQLLANLKKDRPSITDEQCTGAMYKMKDVMGTLIDGQSDLATMAAEMLDEWNERQGAPLDRKEAADGTQMPKPEPAPEPEPEPDPAQADPNDAPEDDPQNPEPEDGDDSKCDPKDNSKCNPEDDTNNQTTHNDMKQYIAIPAAIGEGAMESLDGSLDLTVEQAEALENLLLEGNNREAALQQQLTEAQTAHESAIAELNTAHETAIAELNAAHASEIQTLNEQHQAGLTEVNTQHESAIAELNNTHKAEIEGLNGQLSELRTQIAQLEQQRNDLQATVEELNQSQGQQPQAGEQPASNGKQAPAQPRIVTSTSYDPRLSAQENAKRYQQAQQQLKQRL